MMDKLMKKFKKMMDEANARLSEGTEPDEDEPYPCSIDGTACDVVRFYKLALNELKEKCGCAVCSKYLRDSDHCIDKSCNHMSNWQWRGIYL